MKFKCRVINILLCLGLMLFLGGCVASMQDRMDAGLKPMSTQQLEALFSQPFETDSYSVVKQKSAIVGYYPDGKITLKAGGFSDEGTYRIYDGGVCSKWKKMRGGSEACYAYFKIDDKNYEVYNKNTGTIDSKFKIK